jgi:hypothetical protein
MGYYWNSGSQTYLGWTEKTIRLTNGTYIFSGSPQYEWGITMGSTNTPYFYGDVAAWYWFYMNQGYTTRQALDSLSAKFYGVSFDSSPLKSWLIVYGNMDLMMP